MGFGEAISTCFGKYATFTGRARRSEFWYFNLFYFLVSFPAAFISDFFGESIGGLVNLVIALGLMLPSLSVGVRRLHDIGKSGWWFLLWVIPIIGWIVLIVWWIKDSDPTENIHGPSPKANMDAMAVS
ncbi:MAG: DUF805 domain-containing protein [Rhodospirillaceae bacterium]